MSGTTTITDSKGRRIVVLNKLSPLQKYRMRAAITPAHRGDMTSELQVFMVASVLTVDEVGLAFPLNEKLFEANPERLGEEGVEALDAHFTTVLTEQVAKMEAEKAAGGSPLVASETSPVATASETSHT